MRETERRIRQYQARLPHIRERIIASLMIFAFSVVMMTMSAFAWVTLSVSPGISGVTTTIAANGNLEIALAYHVLTEIDENGNVIPVRDSNNNLIPLLPNDSSVGDSLLPIKDRNLTWGNLINLTDMSYGLDNIVLRPAKLNDDSSMIKIKPFQSVTYGWDGRVLATDDNYRPTQWQIIDEKDNIGAFVDSEYLGVKAISSVDILKTEVESALEAEYTYGLNRVFYAFKDARDYFLGDFAAMMESTDTQTSAIAGLLTTYINGTLYSNLYKAGGPNSVLMHCETTDIQSFLDLMKKLDENVIDNAMLGVMELFDLYRMDTYVDKAAYDADPEDYKKNHMPFTPFNGKEDLDMFYTNAKTMLNELNTARAAQGLTKIDDTVFESFNDILAYKKTITDCIVDVETRLASGDTIYWKDIEPTVNKLVNISTCTINGDTMTSLFSSIRNNISKLSSMLGNAASKNNAVIHGGLIRDLDSLLHKGVGVRVSRVAVSVTYEALEYRLGDNAWMMTLLGMKKGESKVVQANVTTDGEEVRNPSVSDDDQTSARSLLKAGYVKETIAALDTYGLSIDFWIRSNESDGYLILEGEVETEEIPATQYVTIDGVSTLVEPYNVTVTATKAEIDIETQKPIAGKEPEVTKHDVEAYKGSDGKWYAIADGAALEWNANTQEDGVYYNIDYKVTSSIQKMDSVITGYSGANRIWDENELYVDEVEYSTSQGSGSCYTFYADPSELDTILNVLDKMYVVFIDVNGNIRAKAKLDTSLCYSEYGKHIVPLVLFEGTTLEIPLYTEDSGAATVADEGEDPDVGTEDGTEEDGTEEETPSIPTETFQTIMRLEKNEATLLTALIYLDGDKLYNKDVLSSSEIDGQFNIQFGTLERPDPIENEKLQSEQLLLNASIAEGKDVSVDSSAFTTEVAFDGTEPSYDVTLKVITKGSIPNTLNAFFLRKISETQGSRMETVVLEYQGLDAENNGIWMANVSFENAGTYVLRNLEVDGIERNLMEMLSVSIPGFTINNFKSTTLVDNPSTYQYLTSADMVKESFSLNMGANSKKEYPSSVRAVFTNENNINVTVNFTPVDSSNTLWTGDATFSTSGTYTMQYLLLDGEYYDLQTVYTRKVSLGLQASVILTKADEFAENEDFRRNNTDTGFEYIFRGTPHSFAATLRIYDNAGSEVRGLAGVKLYYTGEDTDLVWNPGTGAYSGGNLPIDGPGIYEFQRVTVTTLTGSRESIDVALSADTITAIPSVPVSYDGITEQISDTVYVIAGDAGKITLSFRNASASEVYGKFRIEKNGTVSYRALAAYLSESIKSADGQTSTDYYQFDIPNEDGYWSLEEVLVTNVYDGESGNFYQGNDAFDNGITVDAFDSAMNAATQVYYEITKDQLTSDPNYSALKIVKDVTVSNNVGTEIALRYGDENTTPFMTPHTIGNIKVTVTDFEGKAIENVTVAMQYTLIGGSSKANGGYNYSLGNSNQKFDLTFTQSEDGRTFVSEAITLNHAGRYTPSVTLTFANGATSAHAMNDINVYSMTPTIMITNITPTGSYSVDLSSPITDGWDVQEIDSGCLSDYKYTGKTHADHIAAANNTQYVPKIADNGKTAYVYFMCSHPDAATYDAGTRNGVGSGPESGKVQRHDYADAGSPTVTLTLSGLGSNFTSADMAFTNSSGGAANMCTAYTSGATSAYTWTAEGTAKRYIGSVKTASTDDTKTPAGTISANELVVTTADGTQYTFAVSQITIHNPY